MLTFDSVQLLPDSSLVNLACSKMAEIVVGADRLGKATLRKHWLIGGFIALVVLLLSRQGAAAFETLEENTRERRTESKTAHWLLLLLWLELCFGSRSCNLPPSPVLDLLIISVTEGAGLALESMPVILGGKRWCEAG